MKKIHILIMLGVLPFFITACVKKDSDTGTVTSKEDQPTVITSIRDAIAKSIGVRCEYTDEDGETTITFIKGNRIAMEAAAPDKDGNMFKGIVMDDKLYFWDPKTNQGSYFNLANSTDKEDEGVTMGEDKIRTTEDVINKLQSNVDKCKPAQVSASMFELPSEVTFQEWAW